jgi:uncharacterized protein GlcG (DUF336 family)
MEVVKHRRSPRQWTAVVDDMVQRGATLNDDQKKSIVGYLADRWSQPNDYIPKPPPLRGVGPGLTLALQAAEAAEQACLAKGHEVTVLVVDSAGATLVLLSSQGGAYSQVSAGMKVATVLRFKQSSSEVLKRVASDPVLEAEVKADPEIGEVLHGGLPITVNGDQLIGAIAVSGSHGLPSLGDDSCAQAGLDRIQAGLERIAPALRQ